MPISYCYNARRPRHYGCYYPTAYYPTTLLPYYPTTYTTTALPTPSPTATATVRHRLSTFQLTACLNTD